MVSTFLYYHLFTCEAQSKLGMVEGGLLKLLCDIISSPVRSVALRQQASKSLASLAANSSIAVRTRMVETQTFIPTLKTCLSDPDDQMAINGAWCVASLAGGDRDSLLLEGGIVIALSEAAIRANIVVQREACRAIAMLSAKRM